MTTDTMNSHGRYSDTSYGAPAGWHQQRLAIEQAIEAAGLSHYNRMVTLAILEGESYAAAMHWIDTIQELEVSDGATAAD
jgi:hypothetical protein